MALIASSAPCVVDGTVLIGGTFAYTGTQYDREFWWYPGSAFWRAAKRRKLPLFGEGEPFEWSGDLETGRVRAAWTRLWTRPVRRFADWKVAGRAGRWYCLAKGAHRHQLLHPGCSNRVEVRVSLIAHSHGGHVAVHLAARPLYGLSIARVFTLAMPVRRDMDVLYARAKAHTPLWIHVYGTRDLVQLAGTPSGLRDVFGMTREVAVATRNIPLATSQHSAATDPAEWDRLALWDYWS